MSKIIVLDFGAIQHTAITASKMCDQTPVTYLILRMMIGYLKKIGIDKDTQVVVAQDYGSWRKEVDKNYKAQRKAGRDKFADEEFWKEKWTEINNFIPKLNISLPWHWIKIYKMEADDIASVICRYYKDKEIILVSFDADWEMLLSFPNVKIFSSKMNKNKKVAVYKDVPNPTGVLLQKIRGDVSDNLIKMPSSEAEWEIRRKIVDLINPLPDYVEQTIKDALCHLLPKNFYPNKVPFKSVVPDLEKLYSDKEE